MRKNQVLPEAEFRAELQSRLREVAKEVGSIRQMAQQAGVADSHASVALKVDPESAAQDGPLLALGAFYFDLEVERPVRIVNFNSKKKYWKKTSYRVSEK